MLTTWDRNFDESVLILKKKRDGIRENMKIRAKIISLDLFIKEYANHILSINRIFGWKFVEPLTIFWMTNRYGWNDETRRATVYCLINVFMQRMSPDICNARNSKNWNSPVQRHCVCLFVEHIKIFCDSNGRTKEHKHTQSAYLYCSFG